MTLILLTCLLVYFAQAQTDSNLLEFSLDKVPDDAKLTPQQLAEKYKFPFETH